MTVKHLCSDLYCLSHSKSEHGEKTYLLRAGDKWLLFGAPKADLISEWLETVKNLSTAIDYFVLFGTDSERPAVRAVLDEYPDVCLIGSSHALYKVDGFAGKVGRAIQIRGKRSFSFGTQALLFATVHDKTSASDLCVIDSQNEFLITHSATATEASIALAKELEIQTIHPLSGDSLSIQDYTCKSTVRFKHPTVAIFASSGGYVPELTACIAAGIKDSGNVDVALLDSSAAENVCADAYIFGTAEENGRAAKATWDAITSLKPAHCKGAIAAAFYSAESSNCNTKILRQFMESLGCDRSVSDFFTQGKPNKQTLDNAYEYGFALGCQLQKIPNPRKPRLVKCLVCGEIFDASLSICPVCGVGLEQCVPVDDELVAYRKDTDRNYLILGGGIAAVSAAEAIRRRDHTGKITLLSTEPQLPINRPMLTKNLSITAEELSIHDQSWYTEQGFELKLSHTATLIDPAQRIVVANGTSFAYDRLIYALGAECFIPPIPGSDKDGVITMRHQSDLEKLKTELPTAKNAVVIGGGVLGLEAASELMRQGKTVTVLEAAPQIIGRQVDAETAAILRSAMESMGVHCYEDVSIAKIAGNDHVRAVLLADGREFPADFVIVSCGNRANTQLAKNAGILVDRAIPVDLYMQTNLPDIFACGDCAQFDGINYQLWQEASNQGNIAGANAAGEKIAYTNPMLGLGLEGFGTSLFAIGDTGKREGIPYQTVEITDNVGNRHEKYWFFGGSLEGAALICSPEKTAEITQAVITHARYNELFSKG